MYDDIFLAVSVEKLAFNDSKSTNFVLKNLTEIWLFMMFF